MNELADTILRYAGDGAAADECAAIGNRRRHPRIRGQALSAEPAHRVAGDASWLAVLCFVAHMFGQP